MKAFIVFTFCWIYASAYHGWGQSQYTSRNKRDAIGALDIVSNNAQAIHADVKPDGTQDAAEKAIHAEAKPAGTATEDVTEKPCPKDTFIPAIDAGFVFKVVPPEDAVFAGQSLRKSLPHHATGTLDVIRSVNRLIAVVVLAVTMAVEFYPMFASLFNVVVQFLEL